MRRIGDAYLRPDLPAIRAAMRRAAPYAGEWSSRGGMIFDERGAEVAGFAPDFAQHIVDCHNSFLALANYVLFNEARASDLRGK